MKLVAFAVPLLLLLLTAIAGYAYSQLRYLSLPIPQALALFTVVLPLITGISTKGVHGLIQRSSRNEPYQLTIPLLAVIGFQLIYETIVATLALTHVLPPSSLICGLDTRWQKLFVDKDAGAIKAIQDSFQCCGLHTVKDRAWPFPGTSASVCEDIYGRHGGCLGSWRQAEQINAGLFVLVAVVLFIIKALSIISLLTSPSWAQARWLRPLKRGIRGHEDDLSEDNRATTRRLIEGGEPDEAYHDEEIDPPGAIEENGLLDHGNEWRTEGESQA